MSGIGARVGLGYGDSADDCGSHPGAYDAEGRKVFRPFGMPPGTSAHISPRSLSHPLSIHCHSVEDDRQFLKTCKGVSDKEQFGRDDYWQPPERFEQIKKGDCDDFAFWDLAAVHGIGI